MRAASPTPESSPTPCIHTRQHTSAYVYVSVAYPRILAHPLHTYTPAYVRIRQDTSGYVSIRQDTSTSASPAPESSPTPCIPIRQHTSAYVYVSVACARILAHPLHTYTSAYVYVSIRLRQRRLRPNPCRPPQGHVDRKDCQGMLRILRVLKIILNRALIEA
jgi:hypothetical protein